MRHLSTSLWVAVLLIGGAGAEVPNGDFETDGTLVWKRFGSGINLRRAPTPGWFRFSSTFNSGEYDRIRLYLRIQSGVGTVCFDEVGIQALPLRDPSFENVDGDRLLDWQQDNIGETISVSTDSPLRGEHCLCLHHNSDGVSRVWQEMACVSNTTYEVWVWMRPVNFRGDAYAEIYGVREGQLGDIIWQSKHLSGSEGASLGSSLLQISGEAEARGGLEQTLKVPVGQNLVLTAEIAAPLLEGGQIRIGAYAGDALLGEIVVAESVEQWHTERTVIQSPPTGLVTLRLEACGPIELAYVDNIDLKKAGTALGGPHAQFVEAERNLPLDDVLFIELPTPAPELLVKGIDILHKRFAQTTGGVIGVRLGKGTPQMIVTLEGNAPAPLRSWEADQSYVLSCSESGVRLTARTVQGAFYGLMGLPDLLDQTPAGGWVLLAARLDDRPALPLRATYMGGLPRNAGERINWCERLATLRMNAIVIEDDLWWHLDKEAERVLAQEAFRDFREYGIEPIPELQSFGWAHIILAIDPMCAEGSLVERERLTLVGEIPTPLAHPNVLRTETTDIIIEDAEGIAYIEGRDYEVLDGVTRYVYRADAEPYRVRRLPGSRIPDGATVFATYDYVSRVGFSNCPYCPSEPRVAAIMTRAIQETVRALAPVAVHIGHDEPALMNSDSRCRARHLTNAQLFAEDVWRLYNAAREVDPNILVMLWADAVNPYHNGLQFPHDPTAEALPLLPDDIILNVWFYGAEQPLREGAESLRFLGAQGFATTGSSWDDETCARNWGRVCHEARLRGEECLGVIYTSWGDKWGALETCARSAWQAASVLPGRAVSSE
ncbi:MAG: hypothetical protein ACUVX8_14935 [Candidatus Zipacnadales bacterium]